MFNWLKRVFSKVRKIFSQFIKDVFQSALKVFIAELKDYAIALITTLVNTDMSNEAKRDKAFQGIRAAAISKGLEIRDSWINILIEMALQYVKNIK